jgi:hypothetical protein
MSDADLDARTFYVSGDLPPGAGPIAPGDTLVVRDIRTVAMTRQDDGTRMVSLVLVSERAVKEEAKKLFGGRERR